MGYLYRHIRLDKNEVFYIGISEDIDSYKRANYLYGRNNLWSKITKKSKYKVEIVLEELYGETLEEKEIEFIKLYGRIDLGTGTLANMTAGGKGTTNIIVTPESIKKRISKAKCKDQFWFETKANKKYNNLYSYDLAIYTGINNEILIKCPFHGVFPQTPASHFNSKVGCPLCADAEREKNRKDSIEIRNIDKYINSTFNKLTIKKVFKNNSKYYQATAQCSCGGNITTRLSSIINNVTVSCGCAKKNVIRTTKSKLQKFNSYYFQDLDSLKSFELGLIFSSSSLNGAKNGITVVTNINNDKYYKEMYLKITNLIPNTNLGKLYLNDSELVKELIKIGYYNEINFTIPEEFKLDFWKGYLFNKTGVTNSIYTNTFTIILTEHLTNSFIDTFKNVKFNIKNSVNKNKITISNKENLKKFLNYFDNNYLSINTKLKNII